MVGSSRICKSEIQKCVEAVRGINKRNGKKEKKNKERYNWKNFPKKTGF